MASEDDELMREFLLESAGTLNRLDRDLGAERSFQCHGPRITVQVIKARKAGRLDALSA